MCKFENCDTESWNDEEEDCDEYKYVHLKLKMKLPKKKNKVCVKRDIVQMAEPKNLIFGGRVDQPMKFLRVVVRENCPQNPKRVRKCIPENSSNVKCGKLITIKDCKVGCYGVRL